MAPNTTALDSLRWLRVLSSAYVAALEPDEDLDGGLSLGWHRAGIDFTATFSPSGSLFMRAEQVAGTWDEWADTVEVPGPDAEQRVRDFYMWSSGA